MRSTNAEYFATIIHSLHEQVKGQLQNSSNKYKQSKDQKRKEVEFEIGDLVLAQLRKERFPKGEYKKLKLKKIGPCKILRKFPINAYELELPTDIGILPIFNIANLYRYRGDDVQAPEDIQEKIEEWRQKLPTIKPLEIDIILDRILTKRTLNIEHFEDLVKWKGHLGEDSTWMTKKVIRLWGFDFANNKENSFFPWESNVGAS